ncbi:MAG: delta-60 repeat domain-containing protein [Polyangiaceae bacterium]|nr:delta-60 repeat domain-containing protein [Polyangiaceae bacterium]
MKALRLCNWLVVGSCLASCTGSDYAPQTTDNQQIDSGSPSPEPATSVFAATLDVPALTTVVQGTSDNKVVVTVHRTNGYTGSVFLRVTGLPDGLRADPITVAESADPAKVDQVELTLVADADMPAQGNVDPAPTVVASQADGDEPTTEAPLPLFVRGKPGTLDTTFAEGGMYYRDDLGGLGGVNNAVQQSDGKIVISAGGCGSESSILIRLNADGSLDQTFAAAQQRIASGVVATASDGSIVTAGKVDAQSIVDIKRFKPDGTPDLEFNPTGSTPGTVILAPPAVVWVVPDGPIPGGLNYLQPTAVTVALDGTIYVGGRGYTDNAPDSLYGFFELSPDGVVQTNTGIGSNCVVNGWNPNDDNSLNYLTDLFLVPNTGALTFTGYDGQSIGVGRFGQWWASPYCGWDNNYGGVGGNVTGGTGTAPTTGNNGVSTFTNWTTADASLIDDDGSFVILAHSDPGIPYSLVRVDPTGRQVTSAASLIFSYARGLSRTQDGHYLVAGSYVPPGSSTSSMTVAFHNSDLTLDTSLGDQGITVVPNTGAYSLAYGLAYDSVRAIPTLDGQHTIVVGVWDENTYGGSSYVGCPGPLVVASLWN